MKREHQINFWYVIMAMFAVMFIQSYFAQQGHVRTIPYSEFQRNLNDGQIDELVIGRTEISGAYKNPAEGSPKHFVTQRVEPQIPDSLTAELAAKNVKYTAEPGPGLLEGLLSWLLPIFGFLVLWMYLVRPMMAKQGGLMAIGKSKAKVYVEKDTKTTFADVAGADEAKEELGEIIGFLRRPKSYGRLGAHVPKGILLVGPPGTGKTLLARAVAGEAGVAFFSISGSEFVEMFVGVGAARVRDLFEQARKAAPCIIFIDELDALGRSRSPSAFGGYDEKEQTLNQLLTELDGFDPSAGVILLAAVDRPDRSGRLAILRVHARKITLAREVDLDKVAALTPGFTGADIANLVNEAAIAATRRNASEVSFEDFTVAIERMVAGIEKRSRVLNKEERRRVAYHEMGHALVAASLPGVDPVQKVSIIPRGVGALGYTMQRPTEDRFLLSTSELKNRIAVLMGGRASEELIFAGDVSTGAADDLQRATEIAMEMVTKYGMNSTVGQRTYAPRAKMFLPAMQDPVVGAAEATAREIDVAVRDLIEAGGMAARAILERRRSDLEAGVELLMARETLTAEDFAALRPAGARDVDKAPPPKAVA